jgi:hypothetical protein
VADAMVGGFLDAVGVVAPALDGARVGAVPAAGTEVLLPGDVDLDLGQERVSLVRGERPGRQPGGRRGRSA